MKVRIADDSDATRLLLDQVVRLHLELDASRAEVERLNKTLSETARTDSLTGLGNRVLLDDQLELLRSRASRYGRGFCVAICSVDFLHEYRGQYGRAAGDEALRAVATMLTTCLRSGDVAFRYGDDDFAIILPEQGAVRAAAAVDRVRVAIESLQVPHRGHPLGLVTLSAGVADFRPGSSIEVSTLLARAEIAHFQAKDRGPSNVMTHDMVVDDAQMTRTSFPGVS